MPADVERLDALTLDDLDLDVEALAVRETAEDERLQDPEIGALVDQFLATAR